MVGCSSMNAITREEDMRYNSRIWRPSSCGEHKYRALKALKYFCVNERERVSERELSLEREKKTIDPMSDEL